ncbi:MAG: hypothetical protein JSS23_03335 [Proteobacteria bacterium]|nr:hypothetical protein [Pseudomonadota bacterium]
MARKRKAHTKTDLIAPKVEYRQEGKVPPPIIPEAVPPQVTVVNFGYNATNYRSFDFAPYYGLGIDEITYACQRQVERFLSKLDHEIEAASVVGIANKCLPSFFQYLALRTKATRRPHKLSDINRETIDGYLLHIAQSKLSIGSQRALYGGIKTTLRALAKRGLVRLIARGDAQTFPRNPFPNSARHTKGEKPLSRQERQAFTAAVKTAVMPIFRKDVEVTGELLAYALLIVALHTGRNTTPLLEMAPDCLRPHPKKNTRFLVLWKRRGYNASTVIMRNEPTDQNPIEITPAVKWNVVRLIERVIELTTPLRKAAPNQLTNRVWLYQSQSRRTAYFGSIVSLTDTTLAKAIRKLVNSFNLTDATGKPLRINISRLRKTFANRIFELLDGDLGSTAIALGNTPQVAGRNYMTPNEDSQRNWRFMGEALTQELLNRTLGSTERTPAGRCSDPTNGQYAPKREGKTCFEFLNCLRCLNYVVTGDDLYKLFSFYWRILRERDHMDAQLWSKHYAHIPRLIERDVIAVGVEKKIFKPSAVAAARERARHDPHPYWRYDSLTSLDVFRHTPQGAA